MKPAIFLDRDGVIIENRDDYVKSVDEVVFIPHSLKAIRSLYYLDIYIFIITNQSCVGRGILSANEANAINKHVVDTIVKHGGRIDRVYMCPHAPQDECNCRKPKTGLFSQVFVDYDISDGFMVGDAATDVVAARKSYVHPYLVRTGRGEQTIADYPSIPATICDNLEIAVKEIMKWLGVLDSSIIVEGANTSFPTTRI